MGRCPAATLSMKHFPCSLIPNPLPILTPFAHSQTLHLQSNQPVRPTVCHFQLARLAVSAALVPMTHSCCQAHIPTANHTVVSSPTWPFHLARVLHSFIGRPSCDVEALRPCWKPSDPSSKRPGRCGHIYDVQECREIQNVHNTHCANPVDVVVVPVAGLCLTSGRLMLKRYHVG